MKKNFDKLMKDFCRLCDIADVERLATGGAVEVDDVNFSLSYDEKLTDDRLFMFCDYGEVPEERKLEAYRALLEANLFIYPGDTAVFSVSPETGRVICATRFALQPLRAEELRGAMTFLSRKAKEWRMHHFNATLMEQASARRGNVCRKMDGGLQPAAPD